MERLFNCKLKQALSIAIAVIVLIVSTGLNKLLVKAEETTTYITLYFIDNTMENWVGNDDAVIELVDNTFGHDRYIMTKVSDTIWRVNVPESAYNITFNRYNPEKTTQWNSWSAGGRDSNNVYYVDGSEYGHWDVFEESEEYFHLGDIIYLDISEFAAWENDNAIMYVNFSDASKIENNGQDIRLLNADSTNYSPKIVDTKTDKYIYTYVVSKNDEGKDVLRFWRGNTNTLWNCSVKLDYNQYKEGNNCVKISGWNNDGCCYQCDYNFDYEKDTDGDGLTDYLEMFFGCDKQMNDTDGDRLTDMQEVYYIGSDPTKYDSLSEGVSDADVDIDIDGLSNYEEINIGTNAYNTDTDNDGLNDGKEVNEIYSDPLIADTDGDTLKDGDDIALGFSALLSDTDSNGILDCDEKIFQEISVKINNNEKDEVTEVSVSFEGTGYIYSTTSIEDIYGVDSFVRDTVGIIGVPIEITSTSNFDTATICFSLNEEVISSGEISDLLIMWYDEDNDVFIAQETYVDIVEMTVSTTVTHFSKYLLVDKKEWFEVWNNEIDYSNGIECTYDTVIAIDCSGSMLSNDQNFMYTYRDTLYPGSNYEINTCYRKLAAENYINAKRYDDKTAIVLFASNATVSCPLTTSSLTAIEALDSIYSSGGTNFEKAIKTSVDVLNSVNDGSEKMILLLSDGESSISNSMINSAVANGIVINTVYIGSSTDNNLLKYISEQTGGEYFKAVTAEELIKIYSQIAIKQKIDSTDSDGDGLPDIFEIAGMRLSNGHVVTTNPFVADTDGDGLSDGEEISILPTFMIKNIFDNFGISLKVGAYVFTMDSDPTKIDSDYDRVPDSEDPLKMKYGISNEMSSDYKDKLYSEINAQIKEDFSWIMQKKNVFYYSTEKCIDIIYKYDKLITELSNKYLLPKAAIQTILLRELRCYDITDDIVDGLVVEQYVYLYEVELYNNSTWLQRLIMGYPQIPFPYKEDSSVGYGQIFASTAINANNWAVIKKIISSDIYDYNNWKEREEIWTKLKDDNNYNISMIALVLIYGADDQGLHECYWRYNEEEIRMMLSRYNGFGNSAAEYGAQAYHCYKIFDKYNAMDV